MKKKGRPKANPKHTGSIQQVSKGKNKKEKRIQKSHSPSPRTQPIKKVNLR